MGGSIHKDGESSTTRSSKSSSCRPPVNTTYLTIGQDLFSINEYVASQYNHSLHGYLNRKHDIQDANTANGTDTPTKTTEAKLLSQGQKPPSLSLSSFVPSAFMIYTDLASLRGLWEPTDYGSGVEYADGVLDLFPPSHGDRRRGSRHLDEQRRRTRRLLEGDDNDDEDDVTTTTNNNDEDDGTTNDNTNTQTTDVGLQIGLWLNGTQGCFSIFTGQMDDKIHLLTTYLEQSRASKIFLRVGYEFDNPAFGYSDDPSVYVLAFRKIVMDCRRNLSEDAKKRVLFVWHSWGAPMGEKGLTLERFYPGDDYVDWVGVSIFQQVYPWSPPWGGTMSDVENVLNFAKRRRKPIMIAESTPFGGIELKQASEGVKTFLANNPHEYTNLDDPWERWFGKVIGLINRYDISMWCYINCNWEAQPMWHNVGFGETRLASNAFVMSKWHDLVVNNGIENRTFLGAGSLENCGVDDFSPEIPGESLDVPMGSSFFEWNDIMSETVIFILIPFLVVSGAFYIPYYVLGGHKSRHGISTKKERKPLLSNINTLSIRGGTAPFAVTNAADENNSKA